jgi:hypothetical protein
MSATRNLIFIAIFGATLTGCAGNDVETWLVEDYRVPCVGVGSQLCVRYTEGGESNLLYGGVEGFTAEWGRSYEIDVIVEDVPNPPEDGSSLRYILDEVVSAETASPGDQFEWRLNVIPPGNNPFMTVGADGVTGRLLDGREFRCASPDVCESIELHFETEIPTGVTFEYDSDIDAPLIVVEAGIVE